MSTQRRSKSKEENADNIGKKSESTTVAVSASSWLAPLLCLRSSLFGVAGSVVAKVGLTDEWTQWIVKLVGGMKRGGEEDSSDDASNEWRHAALFYFIRISFVLLKLYLDGRMLQLFVAAMHASNSLLASTYNQCCAVVLAGLCGYLLFSEPISPLWLLGASMILAGVLCVQWGKCGEGENENDVDKDD